VVSEPTPLKSRRKGGMQRAVVEFVQHTTRRNGFGANLSGPRWASISGKKNPGEAEHVRASVQHRG